MTLAIQPHLIHTLDRFQFENGQTVESLRIGYKVYGHLAPSPENLLLVLPGTSNTSDSAIDHIGPGRAYDTDRFCVVTTDALGAGQSSKPSDGLGNQFPRYSVRDLVHAQYRFLNEVFPLQGRPIAVLAGASMGAFQSLEWLINYPDSVNKAVLLVPAWRASNPFKLATARMREFIELDPRWRDGRYLTAPLAGLRSAGRHYYPWVVSDDYLQQHDYRVLAQEAESTAEAFASWDAWDLLYRYDCSTSHDVSLPFHGNLTEALSRVVAQTLVAPCRQDRLLGLETAKAIADGIANSTYREIDSIRGHLAWRAAHHAAQPCQPTALIRRFLGLA